MSRFPIFVAVLMLVGCTASPDPPQALQQVPPQAAAATITASGTLIFLERLALPPTAVVRAELRDVSRVDAPAPTLASQTIPTAEGPPFKFSLSTPAGDVDPRASLAVIGEIRDGDRLMFVSDTRHAVPREGASGMEVRLRFVASAAGDRAPGIVTPVPTAYRCGDETFAIAFEEERAYVTLPDKSLVTLDRLNPKADPEAPRIFTDGRMTFVQETEGVAGPRVLFARGRMVPAPCSRVD